jgi:hypothetical protein
MHFAIILEVGRSRSGSTMNGFVDYLVRRTVLASHPIRYESQQMVVRRGRVRTRVVGGRVRHRSTKSTPRTDERCVAVRCSVAL